MSLLQTLLLCSSLAIGQEMPIVSVPETGTSSGSQSSDQPLAGSITGSVVDGTGAIVPGAHVSLKYLDQSPSQETVSAADGQYSFSNVQPGAFQITITATGFAPQSSTGMLHSGESYIVPPVHLVPATVNTEVEVRVSRVEVATAEIQAQEKQRLFGFVPNFYISYVPDAVPLTAKQKFELAWRSTFDPVNIGFTAASAGVQQAQNVFSGYGQGAQGYAKRFGAAYGDDITSTFIGNALLPALLKQDPRYFYKGTGTTKSRILYAMANAVICKGDNQKWQPNYSGIFGGFASGAISNIYYPPQDRGAALVFENTLIGTGQTAILNIFQEFFSRKLTPHK
jgi:hypothetical protein